MDGGFNCNLDIIRSFHQITKYVLLCISLTEEGGTPLRGGGGGELSLEGEGDPSVSRPPPPLYIKHC